MYSSLLVVLFFYPKLIYALFLCLMIVLMSQMSPENGEGYVEYLISIGRLNEAATKLAEIVNDVCKPSLSLW